MHCSAISAAHGAGPASVSAITVAHGLIEVLSEAETELADGCQELLILSVDPS